MKTPHRCHWCDRIFYPHANSRRMFCSPEHAVAANSAAAAARRSAREANGHYEPRPLSAAERKALGL
jgi:hypothetical protein